MKIDLYCRRIFLFILVITMFVLFSIDDYKKTIRIDIPKKNFYKLENNWEFIYNNHVKQNITIPNKENVEKNDIYIYKNRFPESYRNGNILAIKSKKQNIKLIYKNEVLKEISNKDFVTIKSTLDKYWFFYKFPKELRGEEFELHMTSSSSEGSGNLSDVYVIFDGAAQDLIINQRYKSFFAVIILFTLDLIILVLSLFLIKSSDNYGMFYMSVCLFIIIMWILAKGEFLLIFTDKSFLISRTHYLILNLGVPSFLMWLDESIKHNYKKITCKLKAFMFVSSVVLLVLGVTNKIGSTVWWICVNTDMFIICSIYIFIYLKNLNKNNYIQFMIFVTILSSFTMEVIIFYLFRGKYPPLICLEVGVFICIILGFIYYYQLIAESKKLYLEKLYLSKIAYIDNLTGAYNRTAYNEDLEKITNNKVYTIVNCDCNNLKYVNDNFGHVYGDQIIKDTYDCIFFTFGNLGKVYRIGGDEFVVVIDGKIDKYEYLNTFNMKMKEIDGNREYEFSVSIGIDEFLITKENDIYDAINKVDVLMYEDKKRYKKLK